MGTSEPGSDKGSQGQDAVSGAASMARQFDLWPVDQLRGYANNARTHSPGQIAQLASSIGEWGMVGAIVVRDGTIAKGHGTLAAIRNIYGSGGLLYPAPGKAAGAEPYPVGTVPVLDVRGWSDTQFRAYVVADNQLALNAGWDEDLLRIELQALDDAGYDYGLVGFSEGELEALFKEPATWGRTDPDAVPETKPAISMPGDRWILGVHRLGCGDSINPKEVATLVGEGQAIDCCWMDPPYNVAYESKLAGKIKNDDMSDSKFRTFLRDAFSCAFGVMAPGAGVYVAHADKEGLNFRGAFKEAGFKISGCLVWVKNSLVLGRSDYQWQHEPILYGWKPGAAHRWFGGRKQVTIRETPGSIFTNNRDGTVTVSVGGETIMLSGDNLVATAVAGTVMRVEKPKRSADHPTMKPVELILGMLRNSTQDGHTVLDLFGGSGSTMIACEMLGRQARLMELDPVFVDVAIRRWQEFTGKEAVLEGAGQTFAEVASQRMVVPS